MNRDYMITISGTQPLIMHQDNIDWEDKLSAWQKDPENVKISVKGDDRSPAWKWLGGLYHDGESVSLPQENVAKMLAEGGTCVIAKGNKTFKSQTQSGILIRDMHWPMLVGGKRVPVEPLWDLMGESDFDHHREVVEELGFRLLVKRARVGQSKHIRVRPIFHEWALEGIVTVTDDQIQQGTLEAILREAGRLKGLCDWRPSSKTPGPYGTFTATVEEV